MLLLGGTSILPKHFLLVNGKGYSFFEKKEPKKLKVKKVCFKLFLSYLKFFIVCFSRVKLSFPTFFLENNTKYYKRKLSLPTSFPKEKNKVLQAEAFFSYFFLENNT